MECPRTFKVSYSHSGLHIPFYVEGKSVETLFTYIIFVLYQLLVHLNVCVWTYIHMHLWTSCVCPVLNKWGSETYFFSLDTGAKLKVNLEVPLSAVKKHFHFVHSWVATNHQLAVQFWQYLPKTMSVLILQYLLAFCPHQLHIIRWKM